MDDGSQTCRGFFLPYAAVGLDGSFLASPGKLVCGNSMVLLKLVFGLVFCLVFYQYVSKNYNVMIKFKVLTGISENETCVLYRMITHRLEYFNPLFLVCLMIMFYR